MNDIIIYLHTKLIFSTQICRFEIMNTFELALLDILQVSVQYTLERLLYSLYNTDISISEALHQLVTLCKWKESINDVLFIINHSRLSLDVAYVSVSMNNLFYIFLLVIFTVKLYYYLSISYILVKKYV